MGNCQEGKDPLIHSICLIVYINTLKIWALFTHVSYFDRYLWLIWCLLWCQAEEQYFKIYFSLGSGAKLDNVQVEFIFFSSSSSLFFHSIRDSEDFWGSHSSENVDQLTSSAKYYYANTSQYVSQFSIDISTEREPITSDFTVLKLTFLSICLLTIFLPPLQNRWDCRKMETQMHKNIFKMKVYVQWTCYTIKIKQVDNPCCVSLARGNCLCMFLIITRGQVMKINLILFHWRLKEHDQKQLVRLG